MASSRRGHEAFFTEDMLPLHSGKNMSDKIKMNNGCSSFSYFIFRVLLLCLLTQWDTHVFNQYFLRLSCFAHIQKIFSLLSRRSKESKKHLHMRSWNHRIVSFFLIYLLKELLKLIN